MTEFHNIQRVIVEFVNRDGVPTAIVVDDFPQDKSFAEVVVDKEGKLAEFQARIGDIPNGTGWRFKDMDDTDLVWHPRNVPMVVSYDTTVGAPVKKEAELGPVGRVVLGVVGLAILVPFLGILWAWAAGVVQHLGGLW